MIEWIMKEEQDMDGVYCYLRQGIITRCKDCLFWHEEHNLCKGQDQYTCHTKADDYCSRGRRKHEQT